MFLDQRTRQRLKLVLLGAVAYAAFVLAVALLSPAANASFSAAYGRWLLGIPTALVAWVSLELFGNWALEREFWNRLPSWARVALLVAIVASVAVAIVWLQALWQAHSAA